MAFHESLRDAYLSIAAAEPARCIVIDALAAEDEIAQAIFESVSKKFLAPAAGKLARHG